MQAQQDNQAIRRNAQQLAINQLKKRTYYVGLICKIAFMIAITVILAQTHNIGKQDLWVWLIVYLFDMFITRFFNNYAYRHNIDHNNYNNFPIYKRLHNFYYLFETGWYIYGGYLIWGTDNSQTNISLYKMSLTMMILEIISAGMPILIVILLILCFPCLRTILPRLADSSNGASEEEIKNLPIKAVDPTFFQEYDENHRTCAICMDDFEMGVNVKYLPCKHYYHDKCVDPWLEAHRACPCCRKDISEKMGENQV